MTSTVDALRTAYPGRFTRDSATSWLDQRRRLLTERVGPATDLALAVSSGCASTGAHTHARGLAVDAARALRRWDAGLGATCEQCAKTLPFDRLDSAPAAVRCTGCVPPSVADTRWCR